MGLRARFKNPLLPTLRIIGLYAGTELYAVIRRAVRFCDENDNCTNQYLFLQGFFSRISIAENCSVCVYNFVPNWTRRRWRLKRCRSRAVGD